MATAHCLDTGSVSARALMLDTLRMTLFVTKHGRSHRDAVEQLYLAQDRERRGLDGRREPGRPRLTGLDAREGQEESVVRATYG
jgi:hypothetical protein